jgi:hypothetical protein
MMIRRTGSWVEVRSGSIVGIKAVKVHCEGSAVARISSMSMCTSITSSRRREAGSWVEVGGGPIPGSVL